MEDKLLVLLTKSVQWRDSSLQLEIYSLVREMEEIWMGTFTILCLSHLSIGLYLQSILKWYEHTVMMYHSGDIISRDLNDPDRTLRDSCVIE